MPLLHSNYCLLAGNDDFRSIRQRSHGSTYRGRQAQLEKETAAQAQRCMAGILTTFVHTLSV